MKPNTELKLMYTNEHRVIETYGDAIWELVCDSFPIDKPFKTADAAELICKHYGWTKNTSHRYAYSVLRNVSTQSDSLQRLGVSRWYFRT